MHNKKTEKHLFCLFPIISKMSELFDYTGAWFQNLLQCLESEIQTELKAHPDSSETLYAC